MQKELLIYRDRLINLSTKNRTLLLRKLYKKIAFDLSLLEEKNGDEFCEKLLQLLLEKYDGKIKILAPPYDDKTIRYLENLKSIQRELRHIHREQGSRDLYIGYPFVEGKFKDETFIKAPLLLFSIELGIENDEVYLSIIEDRNININRAFIMAFKKYNEAKLKEFDLKIDTIDEPVLEWIIKYLNRNGITINRYGDSSSIERFNEIVSSDISNYDLGELSIKNNMILGQFPNSTSSIYDDYENIIKNDIKNGPLYNLIKSNFSSYKSIENINLSGNENYFVTELDYSQERAIIASDKNKELVMYGPPGTGKSQVTVNLIVNNLAKGKKVLMVSQKKAAIDVVYNRLQKIGLEDNIADIESANTDRNNIFTKVKSILDNRENYFHKKQDIEFENLSETINKKLESFEELINILNQKTEFGLTLNQLYFKSTNDYKYYIEELAENFEDFRQVSNIELEKMIINIEKISKYLNYESKEYILKDRKSFAEFQEIEKGRILNLIQRIKKTVYEYKNDKFNNRDIEYIEGLILEKNIDTSKFLKILNEALNLVIYYKYESNNLGVKNLKKLYTLNEIVKKNKIWTLSYWRNRKDIKHILKNINKNKFNELIEYIDEETKLYMIMSSLNSEFGIVDILYGQDKEKSIDRLKRYINGVKVIDELISQIYLLERYFNQKFLESLIVNIFRNKNWNYILDDIYSSVEIDFEDIKVLDYLKSKLSDKERQMIDYCSGNEYLTSIRNTIYLKHIEEIELKNKEIINIASNPENIRNDIEKLLEEKREMVPSIIKNKLNSYLNDASYHNNIKYEVDKKHNRMSLRKFVHSFYEKGLLDILPCWLVTPEVVSTIFPAVEGLFDIVIFDEASQLYIEDSIPSIYRAKNVIIAGDDKQLQPNSLYQVKLDDDIEQDEYTEAKSLLELAKYKYPNITLNYHYRSVYEELINFSNYAFYNGKMEVVPNKERRDSSSPIERIMVDGRWIDRRNMKEAEEVVSIVKRILISREDDETIGIITFNSNQRDCIEELLEREMKSDIEFGVLYRREMDRVEGNEYKGIFVKNIENVQGDERDIIIFSIGYAKNEEERVVRQFGTLTTKAGENRLNVAISRARKKIYLVTSIEPEELGYVDNLSRGAILLKKYLQYVRAVSNKENDEAREILYSLDTINKTEMDIIHFDSPFEEEVYEALVKVGFEVYTQVGTSSYRIDMAIYDRNKSEYILGIECDGATYHSSKSARERDMYRQRFLESRGWTIHRIWSRDWWKNRQQEVEKIKMKINELI